MYQKKYFYEFCPLRKETEVHTVEIWQDTQDVIISEEIIAGPSPIVKEMPEIDNKFQPTRGTGATLSLLSNTDRKFFVGLKQVFDKEFMVIHKINGVTYWTGYLNQEMYLEPYDEESNYIVTVTANDGFALLDRYRFLDEFDKNYGGNKTLWDILKIIINKTGLSYNNIKVALSTTMPNLDTTVLHSSYINCANFYDEDNLPMTMREVLDAILAPWGAFIIQENGSIYISDINQLCTSAYILYSVFDATTFLYTGTSNENNRKTIDEIGYYGIGQSIDRSGGINRQVISYSPYPQKTLLNESIVTPAEFQTVPEVFSQKDGYYYKTLYTNDDVEAPAFEETCSFPGKDNTVHASLPYNFPNWLVLRIGVQRPLTVNISSAKYAKSTAISYSGRRGSSRRYADGVALLVEADLLAKVTANPYVESDVANTVVKHGIKFTCQIGNKYYNRGTDSWSLLPSDAEYLVTSAEDNSPIGNKWTKLGVNGSGLLMRLGNPDDNTNFNGDLIFALTPETKLQIIGGEFVDNPLLDETWIKNISIKLVNYDGSEIADNDIEYIGVLDQRIAKEGEKIELICGTQSMFCDRGKLMYMDATNELTDLLEATRAAQTFKIEELLLRSLSSNYRENFLTLNPMKLKNNFSLMNLISDTYTGASLMMVSGATIDFEANTNTCKLVEISQDELDIIK